MAEKIQDKKTQKHPHGKGEHGHGGHGQGHGQDHGSQRPQDKHQRPEGDRKGHDSKKR